MPGKTERARKLTPSVVKHAEARDQRYVIWDTELTGFGLRVAAKPSDVRTFIFRYRAGSGRAGTSRLYVIGKWGPELTPDQARKDATLAKDAVRRGLDPQSAKQASREELTVAELCDAYLKDGVAAKKPGTLACDKGRIEAHIKPLLGRKRISAVTKADAEHLLRDIASGRTKSEEHPTATGGEGAANRTLGLLGGIYTFAIDQKLCSTNPTVGIRKFKDRKKERFLSSREIAALGDALASLEAEGMAPEAVFILKLLVLTGARKNEIAALRWSELDLEHGLIRLEDSKVGARVVRLGAAARQVFEQIERTSSRYVFQEPKDIDAGLEPGPYRGLDWAWVRVRQRAGLSGVRIHDLRHSFASAGIGSGHGLPVLQRLLGHSRPEMSDRYSHFAPDALQEAADRISTGIAAALRGTTAEVVRLREGGG